jgi:anionic cell wall polymer biosynthesis LytR-Cps2A-Psr (LCP) family protein
MDSFAIKKIPLRKQRTRRSDSSRRDGGGSAPKLPPLPYRTMAFLTGGIVVAVLVIMLVLKLVSVYNAIQIDADDVHKNNKEIANEDKTVYNILLAGYGGPKHEGSFLTDTLILAHADMKKKRVVLFSIPRDLWVQAPTENDDDPYYTKINSIYQMGLSPENYPDLPDKFHGKNNAPELLKYVVTDITGVPIDYFVGIDFDGFKQVIDTLGGIEVDVKRTFDDYYYPVEGKEEDMCGRSPKPTLTEDQYKERAERLSKMNDEERKAWEARTPDQLDEDEFQRIATEEPELAFPCRYEHLHFDKGPTELDGETALKFARSRKALQDGGDFNRAARQQQVIEAVKDKILSIGFLPKILPMLDTLSGNIRTDISIGEIQFFLKEAPHANDYVISNYVLSSDGTDGALAIDTSDDGQSILVPKDGLGRWSTVRKIVDNVVRGITPTPTSDPDASGSAKTTGP